MKNPFAEYIRLARAINRAKREGRTDEFLKAARENAGIQKAMMRPMRHETVNGSGEIGWGAFCLCMSLSSYISSAGTWMWQLRTGISGLLMVFGCVAMPVCRWAIKKYVTEPRTGYVAFRRDKTFWIIMVVTAVVAIGVSIGMSRLMRPEMIKLAQSQAHHSAAISSGMSASASPLPGTLSHADKIMLAVLIVSNAIMYLMMNAISIREHRWKWLLFILIALGPLGICYLVPRNYIELFRPLGLFLGLVWLFSGAITLISFIRHHQPPALEAA